MHHLIERKKTASTAKSISSSELVTPGEIAKALKTTPQTVNSWHRKGIITARVSLGRIVRFELAEVMAALAVASGKAGRA